MALGDAHHVGAELGQGLRLDLVDEVGNVSEVGVERAARDAGALGHGGHRDAGEVTRGVYLLREGLAQRASRSDAAAVRALRDGRRGHGVSEGLVHACLSTWSGCVISQPA